MSEKKKFYGVVKGRKPGIYSVWSGVNGAEAQVKGFMGAVFRGFATYEAAETYLQSGGISPAKINPYANAPLPHEADLRKGEIVMFTDGASSGNPGPGGYGVVILRPQPDGQAVRQEFSGGFACTTNNRMELFGVIIGLEALAAVPPLTQIALYSDSRYVLNAIEKGWARRWRAHQWLRNSEGERAENADLWSRALVVLERHAVELHWVQGHADHPENERCDALAVQAAAQQKLPPDPGMDATRCR